MIIDCVNNSYLLIATMAGLTIVSICVNRKLNKIRDQLDLRFDKLSDSMVQSAHEEHNHLGALREAGSKLKPK